MIYDMWTVTRKEFREFLLQRGRRAPLIVLVVTVGILGTLMPWKAGPAWFIGFSPFYAYFPAVWAMSIVADSFAGERERHTLETLLASRLSDRAILFGKIAFVVGYAWGLTVLTVLAGFLTVEIKYGHAALAGRTTPFVLMGAKIPGLWFAAAMTFTGLLVAVLMTCIGTLISMKASSVKQVQQTMGVIMMGMVLLPTVGLMLVPSGWWNSGLFRSLAGMGIKEFAIVAGVAFILLDAALFAAAVARFRRSRLVLE